MDPKYVLGRIQSAIHSLTRQEKVDFLFIGKHTLPDSRLRQAKHNLKDLAKLLEQEIKENDHETL